MVYWDPHRRRNYFEQEGSGLKCRLRILVEEKRQRTGQRVTYRGISRVTGISPNTLSALAQPELPTIAPHRRRHNARRSVPPMQVLCRPISLMNQTGMGPGGSAP